MSCLCFEIKIKIAKISWGTLCTVCAWVSARYDLSASCIVWNIVTSLWKAILWNAGKFILVMLQFEESSLAQACFWLNVLAVFFVKEAETKIINDKLSKKYKNVMLFKSNYANKPKSDLVVMSWSKFSWIHAISKFLNCFYTILICGKAF